MSDVVLLDATTLIALGSIGELELLANFDGDLLIPERVAAEVTTEPARTNLDGFQSRADVSVLHVPDDHESVATAANILAADAQTGDVELLTGVLTFESSEVGVVSDDRRVRTVSSGLGARVTGTIGVVVRAVSDGLDVENGHRLVDELDDHGLHMTGELRQTAYDLVKEAAKTHHS